MRILCNDNWRIVELESNHLTDYSRDTNNMGLCDHNDYIIYLKENQNTFEKKRTLIHELTHAYMRESELSYKEAITEEEMCTFFEKFGAEIIFVADNYIKNSTENVYSSILKAHADKNLSLDEKGFIQKNN